MFTICFVHIHPRVTDVPGSSSLFCGCSRCLFLPTLDCLLQLVEFLLVLNAHWSQSAVASPSSQSSMVARSYKTQVSWSDAPLASRSDATSVVVSVGPFLGPVDYKSLGQHFRVRCADRASFSAKYEKSRTPGSSGPMLPLQMHTKKEPSKHAQRRRNLVTWEMSQNYV